MRLVCPNCDAEYEVDDAAIPRAGRDVQCSNCGHAWFQTRRDVMPKRAGGGGVAGLSVPDAGPDAGPQPEAVLAAHNSEPAVAAGSAAESHGAEVHDAEVYSAAGHDAGVHDAGVHDAEVFGAEVHDAEVVAPRAASLIVEPAQAADADAGAVREPPAAMAAPAPRNIDDTVLAVLREEAAREATARRAEAPPGLETQTEMGLAPGADADLRRVARLQAEADPTLQPAAARPRREMFPAIEEINSTLRSSSGRTEAAEPETMFPTEAARKARGGFGPGFLTLVLVAAIIVALYVFAPLIGQKVPALTGAAAAYVGAIDAARLWLDSQIRGLIAMLRGFEGTSKG